MKATIHKSKLQVLLLLSIFYFQFGFSQEWELGGLKLPIDFPNPPLQVSSLSNGMFSYFYLSQVGGVAFTEMAKPGKELENSNILLNYNEKAKKGYRLTITVGDRVYNPYIPEWQLLPIIKFSQSDYDACVSLYGKHSDGCDKIYEDMNHFHIQYHPAFNNTLLGLRLFQADIILRDSAFSTDLPKFNGKTVLGEGEKFDFGSEGFYNYAEISKMLKEVGSSGYILADKDQDIVFGEKNNNFIITGNPYYYFFWKRENINVYPFILLTNKMKLYWEKIYSINKPVYNAVENTMRYSALFRYVKKNNPLNYLIFLSTVSEFIVETDQNEISYLTFIPGLKTPTIMPK